MESRGGNYRQVECSWRTWVTGGMPWKDSSALQPLSPSRSALRRAASLCPSPPSWCAASPWTWSNRLHQPQTKPLKTGTTINVPSSLLSSVSFCGQSEAKVTNTHSCIVVVHQCVKGQTVVYSTWWLGWRFLLHTSFLVWLRVIPRCSCLVFQSVQPFCL